MRLAACKGQLGCCGLRAMIETRSIGTSTTVQCASRTSVRNSIQTTLHRAIPFFLFFFFLLHVQMALNSKHQSILRRATFFFLHIQMTSYFYKLAGMNNPNFPWEVFRRY